MRINVPQAGGQPSEGASFNYALCPEAKSAGLEAGLAHLGCLLLQVNFGCSGLVLDLQASCQDPHGMCTASGGGPLGQVLVLNSDYSFVPCLSISLEC